MNYNNENAIFIFEHLLRDNEIMNKIDDSVIRILQNKKTIDVSNIPELVLFLMNLIAEYNGFINIRKNLKDETDLKDLLFVFYNYIQTKIIDCSFNQTKFKKMFEISINLAVMNIKFSKKTFFLC